MELRQPEGSCFGQLATGVLGGHDPCRASTASTRSSPSISTPASPASRHGRGGARRPGQLCASASINGRRNPREPTSTGEHRRGDTASRAPDEMDPVKATLLVPRRGDEVVERTAVSFRTPGPSRRRRARRWARPVALIKRERFDYILEPLVWRSVRLLGRAARGLSACR